MNSNHIDDLGAFEASLQSKGSGHYKLRLFVTGSTPRSTRAVTCIRSLCETYLKDRYELEVIDLYQQPHLARDAQLIAAPTLLKEEPLPKKRFIGDMSNQNKLLLGLDIQAKAG